MLREKLDEAPGLRTLAPRKGGAYGIVCRFEIQANEGFIDLIAALEECDLEIVILQPRLVLLQILRCKAVCLFRLLLEVFDLCNLPAKHVIRKNQQWHSSAIND